jgi:hypothetical protein
MRAFLAGVDCKGFISKHNLGSKFVFSASIRNSTERAFGLKSTRNDKGRMAAPCATFSAERSIGLGKRRKGGTVKIVTSKQKRQPMAAAFWNFPYS